MAKAKTSSAVKSAPKKTKTTQTKLRKIRTSIQAFCDLMTLKRVDFNTLLNDFQETIDSSGIRPQLYALLRRYSADLMSVDTIDTLDKVKLLHEGICDMDHINPDNPDGQRQSWTIKRQGKKTETDTRVKAPQEYVQMISDLKRVFNAKSANGLCDEVVYESVKDAVSGKTFNEPQIQVFDIFGTFETYNDLLNALNASKESNKIQAFVDCIEKIELITKRVKALNRKKDVKSLEKFETKLRAFCGSNGISKPPITKQKKKA